MVRNKQKRLLIGLGIAAVAGYGIYRGFSFSEAASNIRVRLASLPKIHRIDFSGIKLSVELRVDNPTKERVTVKIPSVRISYKGKLLAGTAINDRVYTIEPVSTGKISGIMVEAGLLNMFGSGILSDKNIASHIGFDAMIEVNGLPIKVTKV